jgi:hypothetical protein
MTQPISADMLIKTLQTRVAALEKALQVSASQIVLQTGSAKLTLTAEGNVQITAGLNTQITSGAGTVLTSGGATTLTSGGITQIKAANKLILKGSSIEQN